ncbi:TMEM220 (predicted) [Pycnogonum litorale]
MELMSDVLVSKMSDEERIVENGGKLHGQIRSNAVNRSYKLTLLWKLSNLMMSTFFAVACFVQHNDPDPYIWMPVYGVAALLSLSIFINPKIRDHVIWRCFSILHMIMCVALIIYVIIDLTCVMSGSDANILELEEFRELFGLIITIGWLKLNQSCFLDATANQQTENNSSFQEPIQDVDVDAI